MGEMKFIFVSYGACVLLFIMMDAALVRTSGTAIIMKS